MAIYSIEQEFVEKVSEQVRLIADGANRYRVFTPFHFDDGDHLAIVLRQIGQRWQLTDEAHTYMHLSYQIDVESLRRGQRKMIVESALSMFQVNDYGGELVLDIENGQFGDALFSFVQALLKISDVTYLSRERVRSAFMDDFRDFLSELVPAERRAFDWHDPIRDPEKLYNVDCHINGLARPLFVYALGSDLKTRDATIALLEFARWGVPFQPLAIFEEQASIGSKVLARFNKTGSKQFPSIKGDSRDKIEHYLRGSLNGAP